MPHEVFNNQRKIRIRLADFEEFLETVFDGVDEAGGRSAAIAFVSDRKMRELNRDFRGKDSTTDVLSFPFEPDEFDITAESGRQPPERGTPNADFLGDIVISLEQASRQAAENGLTLEGEVKQLILHGILHLCGYDHETDDGEMNARELELRRLLKV